MWILVLFLLIYTEEINGMLKTEDLSKGVCAFVFIGD